MNSGNDPQTYSIIGAAVAVHATLRHGFLEPVHQEAFALEFVLRVGVVAGAIRLSSGTVVIGGGFSRSVKFLSPEGQLLREVGRQGEGPGEFALITAVHTSA